MNTLHILLIVGGGILLLLILFIVCVRLSNKKRFNRLQANLKKIEAEKESFDSDQHINFDDIFKEIDEKALENALVEDYIPENQEKSQDLNQEEKIDKIKTVGDELQKDNFDLEKEKQKHRRNRDKEFDDFLNQHAYSRKILDKNMLDKLKKLPPEIKTTLLNSMFDKFDNQ